MYGKAYKLGRPPCCWKLYMKNAWLFVTQPKKHDYLCGDNWSLRDWVYPDLMSSGFPWPNIYGTRYNNGGLVIAYILCKLIGKWIDKEFDQGVHDFAHHNSINCLCTMQEENDVNKMGSH